MENELFVCLSVCLSVSSAFWRINVFIKSYVLYPLVPLSMTLSDLNPSFKVTV